MIEVGAKMRDLKQAVQALRVAKSPACETARENMRVSTSKYKIQATLISDACCKRRQIALDADYQYQQALTAFLDSQG